MWSRRAQEYDAKINSGDVIAVAEVIRDLYRSDRQPEQSYSERQLFEQALARFARELAAVRKVDEDQCTRELEDFLARNAKRGAAVAEKVEDDSAEEAA
jgi:CarD family transcriptional regulator